MVFVELIELFFSVLPAVSDGSSDEKNSSYPLTDWCFQLMSSMETLQLSALPGMGLRQLPKLR